MNKEDEGELLRWLQEKDCGLKFADMESLEVLEGEK